MASADKAGPGHWNDPDMFVIGLGHLSEVEERTHMALWAYSKAPLIIGADLNAMTTDSKSYQYLTNKFLLSVNQDNLGNQAKMNAKASTGSLGVYNSLVQNDDLPGVYQAYLYVNWDDEKQLNFVEFDPVADGVAQNPTDWCTFQYEDGTSDGQTAGKRRFAGIEPHGAFFFKVKCLPF